MLDILRPSHVNLLQNGNLHNIACLSDIFLLYLTHTLIRSLDLSKPISGQVSHLIIVSINQGERMITKTELKAIDSQYFDVLQMGCYTIYIQSKNTKHFWGIQIEEYLTFRHLKIYHKHNSHNEYHRHRDARSINAAIEHIYAHDAFQINGRKPILEKTYSNNSPLVSAYY